MSKVYVCEVADLGGTSAECGAVNILPAPSLAEYTVIVSAGSSGGQAIQSTTRFVELEVDTTCSVTIGPYPGQASQTTGSAGLTNRRMNANDRIILRVPYQGQSVVNGVLLPLVQYAVFTTANV